MKTAQLKLLYKLLARYNLTPDLGFTERASTTDILRNIARELAAHKRDKTAKSTTSDIPF